jgi:hypothetical protein
MCMCLETGTKIGVEGRREREICTGRWKRCSLALASRRGNVVLHSRVVLTAAKTRFRCLFCLSPRSYYHLRVRHFQQMTYLQRMDYAAAQRSSAGQLQCHRKTTELPAWALRRFGRPRPSCQCTSGNDPAVRARTAHPCLADGPKSRMGTLGIVAAVAVLVLAGAAETGTESQVRAVGGTSQ